MSQKPHQHNKIKITEAIDEAQLTALLDLLHFIYTRTDNQGLVRSSKSLFTLLNDEKYGQEDSAETPPRLS